MVLATEVHAAAPGVWVWLAYDPAVKCDLWSAALETPDGLVVVDPIELSPAPLEALFANCRPNAIVLTSGNHGRSAAAYRERHHLPIWAPRAAVEELGLQVDHPFGEEDPLPGGIRAIALPAAGPGEVALFRNGVVCFGDAVINFASTGLALLPAKYCKNPRELPNELRKLLSYGIHILTFAHGDPIVQHARDRLQQLLA